MDELYVYNETNGYTTFGSVREYLELIIDVEYIDDLFDSCYEEIDIPCVGKRKVSELIAAFNCYQDVIEDEIAYWEDDIVGTLEGGDDTYEFMGDILSFSAEKLRTEVEGS